MAEDQTIEAEDSPVKLPKGLYQDKILSMCEGRRKTWDEWFQKKHKAIKDARKAYHAILNVPPRSQNIFPVPITFGNIETIFARLSNTIFGKAKTVEALPIDFVEDDNEERLRVENFVNQEIHVRATKDAKGKHLVKSTLIDGTGIWRSTWQQDSYEVSRSLYDEVSNDFVGRETESRLHEYWTLENKKAENIAFDPETKFNIGNSPWVSERSMMTLSELLKWEREGRIENVDFIKSMVPSDLPKGERDAGQEKIDSYNKGERQHPYMDEPVYKLDEWWGELTWEITKEGGETETKRGDFHWFVVEGQAVVMFEENPLKPVRIPYYSIPGILDPEETYGMSVTAPTKGLQKLLDAMAGKQADLVNQASNVLTYYGHKSGLNGRASFRRTGGLVPVTDVNQIKESQPNIGAIGATQGFMDWMVNLMRDTTAANEQSQGVDGASTATEFQGMLAAAGTRFAEIADTMAIYANKAMAAECYWHYKQFGIPGQMFVRDGSKSGEARAMLPEDFEGDYEFIPASQQNETNKERSFQDDVAFITTMKDVETAGMMGERRFNFQEYITEVMLPKRGVKNGEAYFEQAAVPPPMAPGLPPGAGGSPATPPGAPGNGTAPMGMEEAITPDIPQGGF